MIIPGIIALFLIACRAGEQQLQEIKEKVAEEKQKIELLQQNIEKISLEINEICSRSLRYRFPDLQRISGKQMDITVPEVPYLKEMEVQYVNTQKMIFRFSYKAQEKKVSPHFILFLFSADGRNIHREEIDYRGLLGDKYLKSDQTITQEKTVQIYGDHIAQYFLIKEQP